MREDNEQDQIKIDNELNNMRCELSNFGSRDEARAVEVALEVGEDGSWVAEQINEYLDNTDTQLKDLRDPVYIVYDSIHQACRTEIGEHTKKDIINDLSPCVEVHGNCICTSFDGKEEAVKETLKLAKQIPEEDRSKKLTWFIKKLGEMY